MHSTAKLLAGAAGLTTAFVAGGFAKDKYNQVTTSDYYGDSVFILLISTNVIRRNSKRQFPSCQGSLWLKSPKPRLLFFLARIKLFNEIKILTCDSISGMWGTFPAEGRGRCPG